MWKVYVWGKSYPQVIRESVLDVHNNNFSIRKITVQAQVSTGFITKVIKEYCKNNSILWKALSGRKKSVLTENVCSFLEISQAYILMTHKENYCWTASGYPPQLGSPIRARVHDLVQASLLFGQKERKNEGSHKAGPTKICNHSFKCNLVRILGSHLSWKYTQLNNPWHSFYVGFEITSK